VDLRLHLNAVVYLTSEKPEKIALALADIETVVVVMMENRSFDHMIGKPQSRCLTSLLAFAITGSLRFRWVRD
jgi:hypothetical protein